jgi:hypothetical protein
MAIVPSRPAAMVRRVTTWSLAVDVVVALILGIAISSAVGFIVFIIGLIVTGAIYYNFRQVMRTKGMR